MRGIGNHEGHPSLGYSLNNVLGHAANSILTRFIPLLTIQFQKWFLKDCGVLGLEEVPFSFDA
jgi:hypothetical protein